MSGERRYPPLALMQARSFGARLRGLLLRPALRDGEGVCLAPCRAVHTLGMAVAIDVVFLDAHGAVLRRVSSLPPGRVALCLRAAMAIELPAGYCHRHADWRRQITQALSRPLQERSSRDSG
ncbi:MAG: DUF192 domain-containing protein [Castellaniella sp.]